MYVGESLLVTGILDTTVSDHRKFDGQRAGGNIAILTIRYWKDIDVLLA